MPSSHPHKSTNVRTNSNCAAPSPLALKAVKTGLRLLSPHAPTLASRWAEHLFLTPRRHVRPSWETHALASSVPGRITYGDGSLPTWTWSRADRSRAPTVLLVHGWEGRGSQLATFVEPLLDRGFRVVAFDAPGHGDSSLRYGSVVEHARAVGVLARTISIDAVIGHSVGGAAALFATRLGLDPERIALIAPPRSPRGWAESFAGALGLPATVERAMIARIEARYAIAWDDVEVDTDAEHLRAKLLVVHDRDDRMVPQTSGKHLAGLAPHGRFVETQGLGHRAILKAPAVIDGVVRFIAGDDGVTMVGGIDFEATLDGELFFRDMRWREC